ncbi:tRNA dihydrouridine synthase DusB [Actinotignum sanguinis]|uniref:tRNA dihydrouridine synthase DusB n=1 Tax=Actinotignum sanguinis TaxID=1445614 RepID=UPI002A81398F|nr:tRNA dihydrouridine synthase DusB [Actinotignum sanguinis]MDY5136431.1 tRNA dihydrouridine synthase DusB [Actinotignum sanguinis]
MGDNAAWPAIRLGDLTLATPVMLAPMAGVTNPPFRQLCREEAEAGIRCATGAGNVPEVARPDTSHAAGVDTNHAVRPDTNQAETTGEGQASESHAPGSYAPAGLWVCEMITSRALLERTPETMTMIQPDPSDPVRSIQLYGVEPKVVAAAVRLLIDENRADHIDINFGCPAPKVTRKGGGSALPWKLDLYEDLVRQATEAANLANRGRDHAVPITVKFRVGIDAAHETFRDVARISEDYGVAGLTLHARTTAQHYAGHANWDYIAELVESTDLPVFGNGDVFDAADAAALRAHTGCAGVAVGRGCQGRPWIFYDLAALMHGATVQRRPSLREVAAIIERHARLSVEHFGSENKAMRELRKHITWYLKGFAVGGETRHALGLVSTLEELHERLQGLDLDQPYPAAAEGKRGRAGGEKRPHLPEGWLDSRELTPEQAARIHEAELDISGG